MNSFGLFEAKNKFSELVTRAQAGEDVVVTKHGRPVARIIAYAVSANGAEVVRRQQESLARVRAVRALLRQRLPIQEIVGAEIDGRRR
ncbi:MAG TPA: type II toxin-antitoxin system prevent-host-death family antitoxin [Caulobacteraceae bacterium]